MLCGSMSILTISGLINGGGGLPIGISMFTACNCIGMVMISMISSTSITSMCGVVLMSIITSFSSVPLVPTFIDIPFPSVPERRRHCPVANAPGDSCRFRGSVDHRGVGNEADLGNAGPLHRVDDAPDGIIVGAPVSADLHFGLGILLGEYLQPIDQIARSLDRGVVNATP